MRALQLNHHQTRVIWGLSKFMPNQSTGMLCDLSGKNGKLDGGKMLSCHEHM